jgi:hypothetical protein
VKVDHDLCCPLYALIVSHQAETLRKVASVVSHKTAASFNWRMAGASRRDCDVPLDRKVCLHPCQMKMSRGTFDSTIYFGPPGHARFLARSHNNGGLLTAAVFVGFFRESARIEALEELWEAVWSENSRRDLSILHFSQYKQRKSREIYEMSFMLLRLFECSECMAKSAELLRNLRIDSGRDDTGEFSRTTALCFPRIYQPLI